MGKLTISMAIFNSYVSLPEGIQLFQKKTCSAVLDRPSAQDGTKNNESFQ